MKIYNHSRVKKHWHQVTFNTLSLRRPYINEFRNHESEYRAYIVKEFPSLDYTVYFESQEDATYFRLKYS